MSLLAGFDLVIEISNAEILNEIKANMQINGVAVNPPFEQDIPIAGGNGNAHMIFDDMQLDLNDDDSITLTMIYENSSVTISDLTLYPLNGSISFKVPLQLIDSENGKALSVNFGAAEVKLDPPIADQQSMNDITNVVKTLQPLQIYGAIVIPQQNGSFGSKSQPFVFENLEVHCISNPDRSMQALGLFGTMLVANDGSGDHTQKTATAILPGQDLCMSISADTFHSLIFCPAVARCFNTDISNLPTSCGGSSLDLGGVTLTNLGDSFADGHINLDAGFEKSGTCYDGYGTSHSEVTLDMGPVRGKLELVPNIQTFDPDIDVDIAWYCYLAAAMVAGPIGIALVEEIKAVMKSTAEQFASAEIENNLGNLLSSQSVSAFSQVNFHQGIVPITPEGLTLHGRTYTYVPPSTFVKSLTLDTSIVTSKSTLLASGESWIGVGCIMKPTIEKFPWDEYSQQQVATCSISATMLPSPLKIDKDQIYLNGQLLKGGSGTVEVPNVEIKFQVPPPHGTAHYGSVHVTYSISDYAIRLWNKPEEGNYSVWVGAIINDPNGNPISDTDQYGNPLSPHGGLVAFDGDYVKIGGDYDEKSKEGCKIIRIPILTTPTGSIPLGPNPDPAKLLATISQLVTIPGTDNLVVGIMGAYGSAISSARAMASSEENRIQAIETLRMQGSIDEICKSITRLTQQLTRMNREQVIKR